VLRALETSVNPLWFDIWTVCHMLERRVQNGLISAQYVMGLRDVCKLMADKQSVYYWL